MNALTFTPVELELTPETVKPSEAEVADQDSAATLQTIELRASTVTPVIEEILHCRPPSHWGINE
jgi:hypothetical protein